MMRKRGDFLKAARARKHALPGFILQLRQRRDGEAAGIRVGFTASKKVGNAVLRNRAKRRLRAVAREALPKAGLDGWDYVLIARADQTVTLPYAQLLADLCRALRRQHGDAG